MVLLDTNVFIYLANGTVPSSAIAQLTIAHSSITEIEALGVSEIPARELRLLEVLFEESYCYPLTDAIVKRATELRQIKRMTLGDAVIAASALEHDVTLWTANTKDFAGIDGLRLHNPLKQVS